MLLIKELVDKTNAENNSLTIMHRFRPAVVQIDVETFGEELEIIQNIFQHQEDY